MKTLLLLILPLFLFANTLDDMLDLYQNGKYKTACNIGLHNAHRYKKDEDFLLLYGFSCLKADYIDRLTLPIASLKSSPQSRANAAYFSVILMQKKLLYHALLDKSYDLRGLHLPTTDYVLSKVFDLYTQQQGGTDNSVYIFSDPKQNNLSYRLFLEKSGKITKMVIEEYRNTTLIKRHTYW